MDYHVNRTPVKAWRGKADVTLYIAENSCRLLGDSPFGGRSRCPRRVVGDVCANPSLGDLRVAVDSELRHGHEPGNDPVEPAPVEVPSLDQVIEAIGAVGRILAT